MEREEREDGQVMGLIQEYIALSMAMTVAQGLGPVKQDEQEIGLSLAADLCAPDGKRVVVYGSVHRMGFGLVCIVDIDGMPLIERIA